jgi:hypothetical protein
MGKEVCKESHLLEKCEQFKKKSLEQHVVKDECSAPVSHLHKAPDRQKVLP